MRGDRTRGEPGPRPGEEPSNREHDSPTLGEVMVAELRKMAAEGRILGHVCGAPVKLRPRPTSLRDRPSPRLPSWSRGTIRIDADVRGHPLDMLARWLLDGPAQGRGTPEQLLDDARKLNRLSGKAYLRAGQRVAASLEAAT